MKLLIKLSTCFDDKNSGSKSTSKSSGLGVNLGTDAEMELGVCGLAGAPV